MNRLYLKAVVFCVIAYFCYGAINTIVSKVLVDVDSVVIFYMMMFISQLVLLPFMILEGKAFLKMHKFKLHLRRGLVAGISVCFFFISLKKIPTVDAVLIKNTAPLFTPIFSYFVLKEKLPLYLWPFIFLGFYGVYLIVGPFDESFTYVHLYPLVTAMGFSYASLSIYYLLNTNTPLQIVCSFNLIALVFFTPLIILTWHPIEPVVWFWFLLIGTVYAIAQYLFVSMFTFAMPGRLAPYLFVEVIVVYFLLQIFYEVSLDRREWAGAFLIICSLLTTFALSSRQTHHSLD